MNRKRSRIGMAAQGLFLGVATTLSGCDGGGAPSVSSSMTETKVHGVVKYQGAVVTEGEIVFDPTNINRKSAKIVSVPIGKDGTYSATTLVGDNTISFKLPNLNKKDGTLAYVSIPFVAESGDNTRDIELPIAKP